MDTTIGFYFGEVKNLLGQVDQTAMGAAIEWLEQAYQYQHRLFLCGNGGSGATASHLVADFQKIVSQEGKQPFRCMSLGDTLPLLTAQANDEEYSAVFARPLEVWGETGDLLIALSGSGNSLNVLRAVATAKRRGIKTIGMTGFDGGKLAKAVDLNLHIPANSMQRVEDLHMIIGHCLFVHLRFFVNAENPGPVALAFEGVAGR